LVVRRNDSAAFTETVDKLSETTEELAEQVSKLTRQNELAGLDERWDRERAALLNRVGKQCPSAVGSPTTSVSRP
jgi:phage-related minor tail protein